MELNPNAASILFPSDAPKAEPPAVADNSRASAANHSAGQPIDRSAQTGDDIAKTLFGDTTKTDYSGIVRQELSNYLGDAVKDGNSEQADALRYAEGALASDFLTAGTDPDDVKQAFEIVRQSRQTFNMPTPEEALAAHEAGMQAVADAGITQADLNSARRFIDHLESKSPGVKASLEAHGAGNDINLIRKAVAEAKRRGF